MSATPRPSLKLTMGKKKAPKPENESTPQGEPSSETPQPKLKLKIGRKPTGDETEDKSKKKKIVKGEGAASKKRREQHEDEEDADGAGDAEKPGPKRIKLIPSKRPGVQSIRIKNKGLVPNRPPGVGYDSEASDTEIDPTLEEQFILRMLPGEDCEYLRQAINERRFDRAEFSFKPLTREGRRAILRIRDKQYAATLVDLPCIIEGMKSWDKRGWYKSADICQMLLVLGSVSNEKEALEYPLPKDVGVVDERTYQYPHGLTPPLKWVRKRRFRERISTRTIEQVEKEVADLIAKDEASLGPPRFELLDTTSLNRAENGVQSGDYYDEYYDDEQDAEGEAEEYAHAEADFEDDLAAEMEAALAAGADEEVVTAKPGADGIHHAGTPSATKPSSPADTSGDESESEAEGDEGPDEDLDEEQLEQQRQLQLKREEIAELEALIKAETDKWEKIQNPILRNKVGKRIHSLKQDLALKKVSIGEGEDMDT